MSKLLKTHTHKQVLPEGPESRVHSVPEDQTVLGVQESQSLPLALEVPVKKHNVLLIGSHLII